jgi:hypothetical protein
VERGRGAVIAVAIVVTSAVCGVALLLFPPSAPVASGSSPAGAGDTAWPSVSGTPTTSASPTATPSPSPESATTGTAEGARFTVCPRDPVPVGSTHLRPAPHVVLTGREISGGVPPVPDGASVRLVHAADLVLTDGLVQSGAGAEVAFGHTDGAVPVRVAARTVRAPVTLAVLATDKILAVPFVEVQVARGAPVRWAENKGLLIGTDGGDGGYYAPRTVPAVDLQGIDKATQDYLRAFAPKSGPPAVCVTRTDRGIVDGVVFSTGYGDGGYPTYLGYDAQGRVVSLVSFGFVLPWRFSGLPGPTPKGVELG